MTSPRLGRRALAAATLILALSAGAKAEPVADWFEETDRAATLAALSQTVRENRALLADLAGVSHDVLPLCAAIPACPTAPEQPMALPGMPLPGGDPTMTALCGCCAGLAEAGIPTDEPVLDFAARLDLARGSPDAVTSRVEAAMRRATPTEIEAMDRRIERAADALSSEVVQACGRALGELETRMSRIVSR